MAKKKPAIKQSGNRFICDSCLAQYRLKSDADEHERLGCKMESSSGSTWSDKEVAKEESGEVV